ncbi:MAG: uroporphyrinogen-III C-methyltransferase, partial [Chloroflexi bacterium]|nr:uroporphyrinogen-III C-methyltransferase [Chloroflexota bacterium]
MDDKPAALPAAPASASRAGRWLLVLALGAALAAGAYFAVEQATALQARIAGLSAEIDALRAGQQQSGSGLEASRAAQQALAREQAAAAEQMAALSARAAALEARVNAIPRADASAFEALALAEARALIGLAEQRLLLARDAAGATAALTLARARLPASQQALAVALGQDLAQLAVFHDADLPGMAAELASLAAASAGLPARPASAPVAAPTPAPAPGTGWQGLVARLWQDLRGLVEIRTLDDHPDPLLDPAGAFRARERVRLALEATRLAVLARDVAARDAALAAAADGLHAAYDTEAPDVAAVLKRLSSLGAVELNPQVPALTAPAV